MKIAMCRIKRFGEQVTDEDWRIVRRDSARLQADLSMMLDQPVEVNPYAYTTSFADHYLHLMRYRWSEMYDHVGRDQGYTHWIGWGGRPEPDTCGQADNGTNHIWTYETCGYRTHIHEWGHSEDLGHSAETGEAGNYGDELSIMGDAGENRIFIAPHRNILGTYGEHVASFKLHDQARSYRLFDSQVFGHSMSADGVGFIDIETTDGVIGIGYDMGRIRAYRPNSNGTWYRTEVFNKDVWESQVGDVTITRGQKQNGLIGVHIHRQPFNFTPVPQFDLPLPPNVDELGEIEGIWNNDATYQGLVIWKPHDNHPVADIIIGWVTWDRVGEPRWCYVLGKRDGETIRGSLVSTERVNLSTTATLVEGEAVLYRDGEELVFHYCTKNLSTRKVRLTRASEAVHSDLTGWYGIRGREHEGLWVSTYRSGVIVAYWLKHTTDHVLKGQEQLWHIMSGNTVDALTIYAPKWAQRTWGTGREGLDEVGSATLSPDVSTFSYTVDGRTHTHELYRVFSFDEED